MCTGQTKVLKTKATCDTAKNTWVIKKGPPVCPICSETPPAEFDLELGRWSCSTKKGKVTCRNECDADGDLFTEDWITPEVRAENALLFMIFIVIT